MSQPREMAPSTVGGCKEGASQSTEAGRTQPLHSPSTDTAQPRNGRHSPSHAATNSSSRKLVNNCVNSSNLHYNIDGNGNSSSVHNKIDNDRTEVTDRTSSVSGSVNNENGSIVDINLTKSNNASEIEKVNGDEGNSDSNNLNERECHDDTLELENPAELMPVSKEDLLSLSGDALWEKWQQHEKYTQKLVAKLQTQNCIGSQDGTDADLRDEVVNVKRQFSEAQRKETYHLMRLTAKDHELQEIAASVTGSSGKWCTPARDSLLDPAVNVCLDKLKRDHDAARTKMEEAQNELAAWKFTPDSNTGKQLMAKCRLLIRENEELGRVISSGKLAKLEGDIALQRNFTEELKKSQSELDEFLLEMDEDTEGMQGTILYLQQQLRTAKQQLLELQQRARNAASATPPHSAVVQANNIGQQLMASPSQQQTTATNIITSSDAASDIENTSTEPLIEAISNIDKELSDTIIPPEPLSVVQDDGCVAEEKRGNNTAVKISSQNIVTGDSLGDSSERATTMLSSVESMIIPHDQLDTSVDSDPSIIDPSSTTSSTATLTNGSKKRIRDDKEACSSSGAIIGEEEIDGVVEPECKRTKVSLLGETSDECEQQIDSDAAGGGGGDDDVLENGVTDP